MSWFQEISYKLQIKENAGWPDRFGSSLERWSEKNVERPIRTISLFSGGGGLDIAFHDTGFDIIEMVEIDDRFIETLNFNSGKGKKFGRAKPICMDIRDYHPKMDSPVDFIIGGPPCQSFSAAGRRASGIDGTTNERGMLFWEYVRLLKVLSPRGFLFENVYGITGSRGGKDWEIILSAFQDAGYQVFHRILDTADYGVPQHRERLIIVGAKSGEFNFPSPTHGPDSPGQHPHFTAKSAIANLAIDEDIEGLLVRGRYGHLLYEIPPGLNYSFFTEKMGHPKPIFSWRSKFSDFLYKGDPEMPVRTIKAQGGQYTGPFHWDNRRFTVAELKRLQTFPDDYEIVGGRQIQIHQIGNSVPPQLGRILAVSVLSQLFNVDIPFDLHTLKPTDKLGFRKRKRERNSLYRKKANAALADLSTIVKVKAQRREYWANLTEEFSWHENNSHDQQGRLKVKFNPHERYWEIIVSNSMQERKNKEKMEIIVQPKPGYEWNIGVDYVRLTTLQINETGFTALWKAFETELIRGGFKADLVQLNAYNQYPPRLILSMDYENYIDQGSFDIWRIVQKVISGKGVKRVLSANELAYLWEVNEEDVLECNLFLRKLGYEVRNWNTNSQIPEGSYWIPYAFPTLNSLSVQLRKSLI